MQYDILLTKQAANGYLARPVLMPEIVVSGEDEEEALALVRVAIAKATVQSRIVRVDVPVDDESSVVAAHRASHAEKLQMMEQAASDPQFLADLQEKMLEFTHSDAEWWESGA